MSEFLPLDKAESEFMKWVRKTHDSFGMQNGMIMLKKSALVHLYFDFRNREAGWENLSDQIDRLEARNSELLEALKDVRNYFWNPDIVRPNLSEGDVQDTVEALLGCTKEQR